MVLTGDAGCGVASFSSRSSCHPFLESSRRLATSVRGRSKPYERAAIEIVLAHLDGDAEVWWRALSRRATLRDLGDTRALAELLVRTGPGDGAQWTLRAPGAALAPNHVVFEVSFPSGVEDILLLGMVEEGGVWKLEHVRCLVDRWPALQTAHVPPRGGQPSWSGVLHFVPLTILLGLLVASLALSMAAGSQRRPRRSWVAVALTLTLVGGGCRPGDGARSGQQSGGGANAGSIVELARLAPLRDRLIRAVPLSLEDLDLPTLRPELAAAAALWQAQSSLRRGAVSEAKAALETGQAYAPHLPLGAILGLELALLAGDDLAVHTAYLELQFLGIDYDGLYGHVAMLLTLLGSPDIAMSLLRDSARAGSRQALTYYRLARLSALEGDDVAVRRYLRTAWQLEPLPREKILTDPLLARSAARREIFGILQLDHATEPAVAAREIGAERIEILPGQRAFTNGDQLLVEAASGALRVPNGGPVAPRSAEVEDAGRAVQREVDAVLADLDALIERSVRDVTSLARREVILAATTLAGLGRWPEIDRLTAAVGPSNIEQVPPLVVKARAGALAQLERHDDARQLLIHLALSDRVSRRRDPTTLRQLAESLVSLGAYDPAIRLIEKANFLNSSVREDARIAQIRLEKELIAEHDRHRSEHFEVVYPPLVGDRFPVAIAAVLEAERARLGRWIPLIKDPERIQVQLYPFKDFVEAYGNGMVVLGLFDGRIRLPFADVPTLEPRLVAILSHELAHALITQATDDGAPHWLQEGLASHVQMVQDRSNPFPELTAAGSMLALPIVDAALRGFCEQQFVELAYSEAAWFVHYIESQHGAEGIKRLVDAFASTKSTDAAFLLTFGESLPAFQAKATAWAHDEAPRVWPVKLVSYDGAFLNRALARHEGLPPDRLPAMELKHQRRAGDSRLLQLGPERRLPVLGRQPARPRVAEDTKDKKVLGDWRNAYRLRLTTIRHRLDALADARKNGKVVDHAVCRALEAEVQTIFSDQGVFASPDRATKNHLRYAYSLLDQASRACLNEDDARIDPLVKMAERYLGIVAKNVGGMDSGTDDRVAKQ